MAILGRRHKRKLHAKVRESIWPTMGWMRTFNYYRHRLFRTGDSNYKIASGLTNGFVVLFSPFVGTHVIQALLLSWFTRSSYVAAFIGTAPGTPWTYPPIFIISYRVGVWVCGLFGISDFVALPESIVGTQGAEADFWPFISYMFDHPVKLLLPMTIGGYLCAALLWPVVYGLLYFPVKNIRTAYAQQRDHRRRKRHETRLHETGQHEAKLKEHQGRKAGRQ